MLTVTPVDCRPRGSPPVRSPRGTCTTEVSQTHSAGEQSARRPAHPPDHPSRPSVAWKPL